MVTWLKELWLSQIQRRLLLTVFLVLGILGCIIAAIWLIACIIFAPCGTRPMHIAIGFDQLVNAATGGNVDETISSRAGRLRKEGRGWACVLCKLLDALDKNHCANSIGI